MYKHLTAIQRSQIEFFLSNGCSIRAIADRMNRSPSTISREIARNKLGPQYCGTPYRQKDDQKQAVNRIK